MTSEQASESPEEDRRLFYCPDCSRVYFLPAGKPYFCAREGGIDYETFKGIPGVWIIPDKIIRGIDSRWGECPAFLWERSEHGTRDRFTREEFMSKYPSRVLRELESAR